MLRAASQGCPYMIFILCRIDPDSLIRNPNSEIHNQFTPASFLSFAALSVFSQVNSGSVLPKWPYAAVFR